MTDWIDDLTPDERAGWDDFVAHARRDALRKIDESAFVLQIVPDEPDVKIAVELGFTILLDKPLVLVAAPGQTIPPKLLQIADRVVHADVDLEEGRQAIADAMRDMAEDR